MIGRPGRATASSVIVQGTRSRSSCARQLSHKEDSVSELIDAQKNAPPPGSAVTMLAWIADAGEKTRRRSISQIRMIRPMATSTRFSCAPPMCWKTSLTDRARKPVTVSSQATTWRDEWKKAFAGISHIAKAQSSEDKMEFENLQRRRVCPRRRSRTGPRSASAAARSPRRKKKKTIDQPPSMTSSYRRRAGLERRMKGLHADRQPDLGYAHHPSPYST